MLLFVVLFAFGCSDNVKKGKKKEITGTIIKATEDNPLPSWNDTETKHRIIDFVEGAAHKSSPDYIKPEDRIAVFDNDGTMWCEKPAPFQVLFAFDMIRKLAKDHPEWEKQQPYKAIINKNMKALRRSDSRGILEVLAASHLGMSNVQFSDNVWKWLNTDLHPRFNKPYSDLVYQPMLELMQYLKRKDFKVFIVSGGGIDFMRSYIPKLYGVPDYQILGSYSEVRFENGQIIKEPLVAFINNEQNKPVAIYRQIGIRPVFACGNTDGDLAMLQYSTSGQEPSLQVLIHHTDNKREYAYGNEEGPFAITKGLRLASKNRWVVVDMKNDWKEIFKIKE
jgi:phosphoserine phosphatase